MSTASSVGATPQVVVEYRSVTKTFGAFSALTEVAFAGMAGSVHAITGENGAGKSTLMKILAGVHKPDSGELLVTGAPRRFAGPDEAREAGISTVFQELTLLPNLTIAENLFLGREPLRFGLVDRNDMRRRARVVLAEIGIERDVDTPCGTLSVGDQHLIEIAKGAVMNSRVVIYDEPTAALDAQGVEMLMALIDRQRRDGKLIFYISHRLDEIFRICDTVTVLKDGKHIRTCPTADLDRDRLVSLMVGRDVTEFYPERGAVGPEAAPALLVENLRVGSGDPAVSFVLRRGEILGLAGLEGQGQRDILRTLAGLVDRHEGTLRRFHPGGAEQKLPANVVDVVKSGLGFVPEDRKTEGLYLSLSIQRNMALGRLRRRALWRRAPGDKVGVRQLMADMNVRARGPEQAVGALSGGNQQKVMIGRWLSADVDILLVEEPTRGVDVGAKAEIYRLLRDFANNGGAVLMTSSEMTEHLGLCDRLLVVRGGAIVADLVASQASEEIVARHALMGQSEGAAA